MSPFRDEFARTLAAYIGLGLVVALSIHLLVARSAQYGALFGQPPAARSEPSEARGAK